MYSFAGILGTFAGSLLKIYIQMKKDASQKLEYMYWDIFYNPALRDKVKEKVPLENSFQNWILKNFGNLLIV